MQPISFHFKLLKRMTDLKVWCAYTHTQQKFCYSLLCKSFPILAMEHNTHKALTKLYWRLSACLQPSSLVPTPGWQKLSAFRLNPRWLASGGKTYFSCHTFMLMQPSSNCPTFSQIRKEYKTWGKLMIFYRSLHSSVWQAKDNGPNITLCKKNLLLSVIFI